MIPEALIYLGVMLAVICLWMLLFKRPIHEGVVLSFVVLIIITGTWGQAGNFFVSAMKTPLLYSMVAFIAMSQILTKTKIVDNCVMIIISLLGRIPGGAGYASIIASAFMGALSGSGPGNVMATGTITIPAMKKTGFPPELAANVESTASYLGNMIPPSANIVAALGAYLAFAPESEVTAGRFWVVCWGLSLWFILSRMVTLFVFCLVYKIKPMEKADIPPLGKTLKEGRSGLLLPIIILLPFVLDSMLNATFIAGRLGETGAKYFSSSLLIFVAGIATIYGLLVGKDRSLRRPAVLVEVFSKGVKGLAPIVVTCIFGYAIGELFEYIEAGAQIKTVFEALGIGRVGLCLIVPLLTCFVTMVIPGSSVTVMFGTVFISLFASVGADPLLVAAMLPCMCGVMCGITPPFALGMYAGMSIAGSDFGKTLKNDLWWVAVQYVMEVIVLLGWLPVVGL
ncbi:MAG: TRAP transporter large permease subunit [Clostridia bacterium]|nr:TRAP transporter large permease subunit [Clostridia bacterium]